ncbi:MAG: nitroreductase family protein [Candidatus Hydrogenedentes bacterium]|nr:nitroreductase family protein [Candidatus Hydrogenedentota bacterium]
MPDFCEVLKTRRSVRVYSDRAVDEGELEELIQLATFAPSGGNRQPWTFTVITDKELMHKLNERTKAILRDSNAEFARSAFLTGSLNNPEFSIFYNAPVLILINGKTETLTALIDCQLAAENLFLAAHARGLGTCYMGFLLYGRDDAEVRRLLRIPEGQELMAAAIVGHPSVALTPPMRDPARITWIR